MNASGLVSSGLYHLTTPDEWAAYRAQGQIAPPSLRTEGFVHCSWGHQVDATVSRHFADVWPVLVLRVDPTQLDQRLVEEDLYGRGEAFPHIYGPILSRAVVEVAAFTPAGSDPL